jgi:hypothetical protein
MGGGGFSMEPDNPLLDDFVLSLSRRQPVRVCFLATASGASSSFRWWNWRRLWSIPSCKNRLAFSCLKAKIRQP